MFRHVLSFSLAASLLLCTAGIARAGEDPAQTLQRVLDDLEVMDALLSGRLSEATRRELQGKVEGARGDVRDVQQQLLRGGQSGQAAAVSVSTPAGPLVSITMQVPDDDPAGFDDAGEPPAESVPVVMADGDFQALLGAVEGESFEDGKLGLLRDACQHNYFASAQVVQVVSAFSFSDGMVEAAVMLHPRTVDPENFFQVYGAFDFDDDKDEVRRRLGL